MSRNIRGDESVLENVLSLVEALLQLSQEQDCESKLPLCVVWNADKLRITGYKSQQTRGNRSKTSEIGAKKEYLLQQIKNVGKTLKLPRQKAESNVSQKERELQELQTALDWLWKLRVREPEKAANNQGYWKFTLTLKHQTATIKDNLEVVKQKWKEYQKTNLKETFQVQTTDNSFDWQEIYGAMLEKHKRLTTNEFLFAEDEMKFELKEIHVPLALVERNKPKKCSEDISPEQGSQLYEPSYEEKQRFEHQAFLEQIIRDGVGKTQGHRIALIGEPGAGKTTQLQTIAFWILNKNLGLPIWISLADLQGKSVENYLLQHWLKNALEVVRVTEEQENAFADLFKNNSVWLLLDAADEMSSPQPLTEISQQLMGWVKNARVVLTCRVNVWEANANALENFETYRLLNFEYPQQVQEFIGRWFHNKDADKGERLWQELDKAERQRIQDLVKNPLRLALLCSTWQSSDKGLPETKAGLYQQFVEEFYNWKENRFPTSEHQQEELNAALGRLVKRAIHQETSRFRLRHKLVREELGDPKQQNSLFWLALKLGWLNEVGLAAESATKEKVYAFYHPTFEEYFAGLAVDDWHEFLNHVPDNPALGVYRIFEPQWKEVILLWLGREDVEKEEKNAFLDALVGFDDSCGDFYGFKSYFLAAMCLAEYESYKRTKEIFTQLIDWGFGDLNRMREILETPITTNANAALIETNRRQLTIFLTRFLHESHDEEILLKLAKIAVEIKTDNEDVEHVLNNLQSSKDLSIRFYASCVLDKLRKKHSSSIETKEISEQKEKIPVLDENNKIVGYLTFVEYFNQLRQVARFIHLSSDDNSLLMDNLNKLLKLGRNKFVRSLIARAIGEICGGNFHIYNALIKIIYASKEGNVLQSASFCLIEILQNQLYPLAVNNLKECINQKEEDDSQFIRRIYCYEVIWKCAQSMPYPAFYQAWHQQEKVKDEE
ncbi:NACHT domain-containing protein [Nostoc sp. ChiQUE01b]|uniref:NACHT domain-containing protein n=1 Tax=Nostoc sp. ChiQUE01b TaxID=3075376 RepID=UPI002AD4AABF|nr:NACHT domain-containing protein [Nostoc sp. ChiQUE01b]MDZ8263148.1 NACHT domain-containing protein [Nostoc sp. ChiQUE01b]